MKPLALIDKDAPVRRVTDWLINERWDKPVSIITIMMICETIDTLGQPFSGTPANEIYETMQQWHWLVLNGDYLILNPQLGDRRGMSECPHCHSKLWHGERENVSQRKARLESSTSVSMLARDDEPVSIEGV